MSGTVKAPVPIWRRASFLRALVYLVVAGVVAAGLAEASVRDCVADHSGPGEDISLCGVGYVFGPIVFIGLLVGFGLLELLIRSLNRPS